MPRLHYFSELNVEQRTRALALNADIDPQSLCYVIDVNGAILRTLALKPIFEVGEVKAAKSVSRYLIGADRPEREFAVRHANGDWSEMDLEEQATNRDAIKNGGPILSRYTIQAGVYVYVLTRADRCVTSVFMSTLEPYTLN